MEECCKLSHILEICVDGVLSARRAEASGAHRLELCAALVEGGITPSVGLMQTVCKVVRIPVRVIIRPRGGDFVYDPDELAVMLLDIDAAHLAGAQGVVIGVLTRDGQINEEQTRILVLRAAQNNLGVTFHRAIDMTRDVTDSFKKLLNVNLTLSLSRHELLDANPEDGYPLGKSGQLASSKCPCIDKVLTSGGTNTVMEGGYEAIRQMVSIAKDFSLVNEDCPSIDIIAASGVSEDNVLQITSLTGASELHGSLRHTEDGLMEYRRSNVFMGGTKENTSESEFQHRRVDSGRVERAVHALASLQGTHERDTA
eukprot:m.151038 g.151038  ORF g.151038 m.151038 type:complete len:313 (-) comp17845_c0_seq2:167-1105(-)